MGTSGDTFEGQIGLEEKWKRKGKITSLTEYYVDDPETTRILKACSLLNRIQRKICQF